MPKPKTRRRTTASSKPRKKRQITKSAAFWDRLSRQEPNNAEMTLFGIMCYLGLSYKYTGNGQFILSGMCPDFVHLDSRKIVEMYGERWQLPQEEQERIDIALAKAEESKAEKAAEPKEASPAEDKEK